MAAAVLDGLVPGGAAVGRDAACRRSFRYRKRTEAADCLHPVWRDSDFLLDEPAPGGAAVETDAARLAQRQKQIDYGKNTLGYVNYLNAVPRCGAL